MTEQTAFDRLRNTLDERGSTIRDRRDDQFQAQCPAHDDRNPSLSVTGISGQVLLHCHAGCNPNEVLTALWLSERDLFDNKQGTTYQYPDGKRNVRRLGKKFWREGNTTGIALYHGDLVPQERTRVFVTEGEKDVLAVEALGGIAVTSGGVSSAGNADWSPLSGHDVVIVEDQDENGEGAKYSRTVAEQLQGLTNSKSTVRARAGKDSADHIAAGYCLDEFEFVQHDDEETWDLPIPLGEPEQSPFPVDCLGPLRSIVEDVARAYQVRADLPALTALAVVAAALGGQRTVRIKKNWSEVSGLFVVTVANSSERKSPPFKFLTNPLEKAEYTLAQQSEDSRMRQTEEHEVAKSLYDEAKREAGKIKNQKTRQQNQDETQNRQDPQQNLEKYRQELQQLGEPPAAERIIASDITPEKAAALMYQQNERLALLATEGGIFETMAGRYSGVPNFDPFTNGYSGDAVIVDRQGADPIRIRRARMTMALSVQPHILENIGRKPEAGFRGVGLLGRFLYALPAPMAGHREIDPADVSQRLGEDWDLLIQDLALNVWNKPHHDIWLDPEADQALRDYRQWHEPECNEDSGRLRDLGEWAGKLPGHLVRIALALTMAEDPKAVVVTGQAMRNAIGMSDYLEAHARHAYSLLTNSQNQQLAPARAVLKWIERTGTRTFSTRDAHYGVKGQIWATSSEVVGDALNDLADHLWVAPVEEDKASQRRGRPQSPCWQVSPHLFAPPPPSPPSQKPHNSALGSASGISVDSVVPAGGEER